MGRVEITLKNGEKLVSGAYEPMEEINTDVTISDLKTKIHEINGDYASKEEIDHFIDIVLNTRYDEPFAPILKAIQSLALANRSQAPHI